VCHIAETSSSKVSEWSIYHLFRSKAILYRKWSSRFQASVAIAALYLAVWFDRIIQSVRLRCGLPLRRSHAWSDHAIRGLRDGWAFCLDETDGASGAAP
jgi:hypothetical protein